MSSKKRVKSENIEILAGGSNSKKSKIIPRDPFEGRFAEIMVEIPNVCMMEVCSKLFNDETPPPLRFEIKSYKSELSGTAKTVCGETLFIEESKVSFVIVYEKGKKEDLVRLLNDRFPFCYFNCKKEEESK